MNNNQNNGSTGGDYKHVREESRSRRVEIPVYHYNAPPTYQASGSSPSQQYTRSFNNNPQQQDFYPTTQSQIYNDFNRFNNATSSGGQQYDYDPPPTQQHHPSHYYSRSPPRDQFAKYTPGSYYQPPSNRRHESPQPNMPSESTKPDTTKKFIPINVINSGGVKMGNTIDSATSSGNPSTTAGNTPNSRQASAQHHTSSNAGQQQQAGASHQQAATAAQVSSRPSAREKLDMIHGELNSIRDEIDRFVGKSSSDKNYLRLEELLTRCLLKLDEIERSDDEVTQLRKRLINLTHELSDLLDKKISGDTNDNVHSTEQHT